MLKLFCLVTADIATIPQRPESRNDPRPGSVTEHTVDRLRLSLTDSLRKLEKHFTRAIFGLFLIVLLLLFLMKYNFTSETKIKLQHKTKANYRGLFR